MVRNHPDLLWMLPLAATTLNIKAAYKERSKSALSSAANTIFAILGLISTARGLLQANLIQNQQAENQQLLNQLNNGQLGEAVKASITKFQSQTDKS